MLKTTVEATLERNTAMKQMYQTQFSKESEMILQHKSKIIKIALNRKREIFSIQHLTPVITIKEELITCDSIWIEDISIRRFQGQELVRITVQLQPIALLKLLRKSLR